MPENFDEQEAGTRPFWSGTITFGLVSVPVSLYPANRGSKVSLRMLGPNGKPLARRYYSDKSGEDLDADDIIRGYEIAKGRFVEITDEEFERLAPERSRDINLQRFVDESSIPRLYFERAYFLAPSGSARAYHLLAETMARTKRAGIATFVMRGIEYLVAITSEDGILRAETMRFHDEIRSPKQVGLPQKQKVAPAAVKSFERAIAQRVSSRVPITELRDTASQRMLGLIKRKRSTAKHVVKGRGRPASRRPADVVAQLQAVLGVKRTARS